ncbi:hypothetical protein A3I48_00390 [Candidatus Daviesbacteria bacterium RIFCSPLOWO2_02_FULL_36_7]|uniref:Uncharacterized protein n=1 Tax=Candidatus Daviesbacteria bacterium RIFCSPLOWO2_02_FULL_36_7 TaxID=1797792 RepID=A0A1F5MH90_9BACT|nr:MAG: hypothetical protein A3I48_00390 [Candidatus Daviesbacteria bacterium RIFCSPLOWO2_02_FULL_36_7]
MYKYAYQKIDPCGQDESSIKFTLSEVEGLSNSKILSPQGSFGENIIQDSLQIRKSCEFVL